MPLFNIVKIIVLNWIFSTMTLVTAQHCSSITDCKLESCQPSGHVQCVLNACVCNTCAVHLHCQHGGHCVTTGHPETYQCICPAGFNGPLCEIPDPYLDPCNPSPCQSHEDCIRLQNHTQYECREKCAAHLHCQHDGYCETTGHPDTYKCICPAGFNGTLCENDVCGNTPCGQQGTCHRTDTDTRYYCTCNGGYFGTSASDNVDHMLGCDFHACDIDKCAPHGRCLPFQAYPYYYCECDPGYYGVIYRGAQHMYQCDQDACQHPNHHCHNKGTCVRTSIFPFYRCDCNSGFTGPGCQTTILPVTQTTVQHSTTGHVTTTAATTGVTATTTHANPGSPLSPNNDTFHYCLACTQSASPHMCEHVTLCGSHEQCYVDGYVTPIGSLRYNLGCRDSKQCITPSKRDVGSVPLAAEISSPEVPSAADAEDTGMPIVCSVCCTGSMCNSGGCGHDKFAELTSGTRGPICFDCYQQLTTDDCDKIRICSRNEVCDLRQTTVGTSNDVLWETSCVSRQMCPALNHPTLIGKKRQTGNLCCDTDLCNTVDV